jgi:hypothetical protein
MEHFTPFDGPGGNNIKEDGCFNADPTKRAI